MPDTTMSDTSVSDTDSVENGASTDTSTDTTTDPTPDPTILIVNGFTLSDPDSGHHDVRVSVETTAGAAELWQCWLDTSEIVEIDGQAMSALCERWQQATTSQDEKRLWADYQSAARNLRVLSSWRDVLYAAYVFATDGNACVAREFTPPPAPLSGPREF